MDQVISNNKTPRLSAEEEALYRPIYEALVDENKVVHELGNGQDVKAKGPAVSRQKAQKLLRGIASDVCHFFLQLPV